MWSTSSPHTTTSCTPNLFRQPNHRVCGTHNHTHMGLSGSKLVCLRSQFLDKRGSERFCHGDSKHYYDLHGRLRPDAVAGISDGYGTEFDTDVLRFADTGSIGTNVGPDLGSDVGNELLGQRTFGDPGNRYGRRQRQHRFTNNRHSSHCRADLV